MICTCLVYNSLYLLKSVARGRLRFLTENDSLYNAQFTAATFPWLNWRLESIHYYWWCQRRLKYSSSPRSYSSSPSSNHRLAGHYTPAHRRFHSYPPTRGPESCLFFYIFSNWKTLVRLFTHRWFRYCPHYSSQLALSYLPVWIQASVGAFRQPLLSRLEHGLMLHPLHHQTYLKYWSEFSLQFLLQVIGREHAVHALTAHILVLSHYNESARQLFECRGFLF